LLIAILSAPFVAASLTNGSAEYLNNAYRNSGSQTLDPIYLNMVEVEGLIGGQKAGLTTSAADSLAIPITAAIVTKTTGADAEALTIVDGEPGQRLTITLGTDGNGDGTLTVGTNSTGTGWATVVFADAGDTITIEWIDDTVGWILTGCFGLTAQPTVTK
jgi:hypothetical protein